MSTCGQVCKAEVCFQPHQAKRQPIYSRDTLSQICESFLNMHMAVLLMEQGWEVVDNGINKAHTNPLVGSRRQTPGSLGTQHATRGHSYKSTFIVSRRSTLRRSTNGVRMLLCCSLFQTTYYSCYRTVGHSRHWLVKPKSDRDLSRCYDCRALTGLLHDA